MANLIILFFVTFSAALLGVVPPGLINLNAAKISTNKGKLNGIIGWSDTQWNMVWMGKHGITLWGITWETLSPPSGVLGRLPPTEAAT